MTDKAVLYIILMNKIGEKIKTTVVSSHLTYETTVRKSASKSGVLKLFSILNQKKKNIGIRQLVTLIVYFLGTVEKII